MIVLIMQGNRRFYCVEQISKMQAGMISFMAEVAENRDDNTGGHIRRTANYVEGIARELESGMHFDPEIVEAFFAAEKNATADT